MVLCISAVIIDFCAFSFCSFRYVRILGNMVHAIQIKTKLCQLVEVMMERRDDLSFCQEMKFRSVMPLNDGGGVMWKMFTGVSLCGLGTRWWSTSQTG